MSGKFDKGPVPPERIEELVRAGRRRSSITSILTMEGYSQEEIDRAFTDYQSRQAQRAAVPQPTPPQQPPKGVEIETPMKEKPTPPPEAPPSEITFQPLTIPDTPSWNPPPSVQAEQVLAGTKPNEMAVLTGPVKGIATAINGLGENLTSLRKGLEEDRSILKSLNVKMVDDLSKLEKRMGERVSSVASSTQTSLSSIATNITGQIKNEVVERLNKIIDSLDKSQASSQRLRSELSSLKSFLNNIVDEQTSLLKRIEEIERQQSESRTEIRELRAVMRRRTED